MNVCYHLPCSNNNTNFTLSYQFGVMAYSTQWTSCVKQRPPLFAQIVLMMAPYHLFCDSTWTEIYDRHDICKIVYVFVFIYCLGIISFMVLARKKNIFTNDINNTLSLNSDFHELEGFVLVSTVFICLKSEQRHLNIPNLSEEMYNILSVHQKNSTVFTTKWTIYSIQNHIAGSYECFSIWCDANIFLFLFILFSDK